MRRRAEPIGVILAGGIGRRIGGSKAMVQLGGRPLITYPLNAVAGALRDVAIIAKADTELPSLPGVTVWIEPAEPRHPLVGIVEALALAGGRPVLVCALDLPFVSSELVNSLARCDPKGRLAVVASSHGQVQPLLGCYQPKALQPLNRAIVVGEPKVTDVVRSLGPRLLEVVDPDALFNINAPDDLLQAAAMLDLKHRQSASTRR